MYIIASSYENIYYIHLLYATIKLSIDTTIFNDLLSHSTRSN